MSKELGAFIRAHRERTVVEPAASAPAGRRRTPGLRREELAALCGASTTWISWLGQDTPDGERNLLRFMFLQGEAKELVIDWPQRARRLVAEFRAECGKGADASPLRELVAALQQHSADFLQFWNAQEVLAREGGTRTFMHPVAGRLVFEQATLQLQGRPDLKLTMLLPAPG